MGGMQQCPLFGFCRCRCRCRCFCRCFSRCLTPQVGQMLSSPSNLQNSPNINKPKAKINPKSWHTRYPRSCKIEVVEINQKSSPATIAGLFFCHCRCLRRSSPKGGFKAICQIFSRSWIKSRRIRIGIAEFCTIIDASFPLSSS